MRTVFYMRMSTDKQENSIDSQRAVLSAYLKQHRMILAGEYMDEGISGRTAEKRPSFLRMIDDSAKNIFDAVLVYDSSRFARNLEEAIVYKAILKKNGVALISATEPLLDDDSALITDAMLGALNEMYSRKLSKAVKRGMIYNAQKGKYQTPPPYGYKKHSGVMSVVTEEAEVVRHIFDMFIERPSWFGVAARLNSDGIKKRRAYGWYSRDIVRILKNPAYIGNVCYGGEVYKGEHERIIDNHVWEKVQELIAEKPEKKQRPSVTYRHWLSGLLRCAYCGGRMNHSTDIRGNTSYRCSKNANGCCEKSNFMSVGRLETLMRIVLEMLVSGDSLYYKQAAANNDEKRLEQLHKALKRVRLKIKRFKEAYSEGIDGIEEYRFNKEKCQKEERDLLEQIETLSTETEQGNKVANSKANVSQLIDLMFSREKESRLDIEQKSLAVKNVINKIVLNKYTGEIDVYYYK